MKNQSKTVGLAGLIVGLLVLIIARPWSAINQAAGIYSLADSLRADTLAQQEVDSLIFEDVKVALPAIVSDSLTYTVNARTRKKALLEEQSAYLQKENQKLDAAIKKKQQALQQKQQTLVSLDQIETLIQEQKQHKSKPSAGSAASDLDVSDLETELNQRRGGRSNSHP